MWEILTDGDFFRMRLITTLFFGRSLSLFGETALPTQKILYAFAKFDTNERVSWKIVV